MTDIGSRNTGSALLNEIHAKRIAFLEKINHSPRRSPPVYIAPPKLAAPEAVPEQPVIVEKIEAEIDTLPQFPFLPRQGVSFADYLGPSKIRHIQRIVAAHFSVLAIDMVSTRRAKQVVIPRMIAMYLSRILTTRSTPDIGRRFGGRDHTTVIYGIHKVERMIAEDAAFAEEIETLKGMMG